MRSEEAFDRLVANVRDYAIFLLDARGHVMSWNAGAERLKGYRAEEIIGQHFSRFYTPEAVHAGWPAHELEEARLTGRFEDEGWRVRKDGTRFWASVVITALREGGEVRGILKITRDLTERKQAEDKLRLLVQEEAARKAAEARAEEARRNQREERRLREQLHVTLASIGDAVIVTDQRGTVTFLNPVASRLTGWETSEATGQPLDKVFHILNEKTRQVVESPVSKVLREGTIVGLANHTVLVRRDGHEFLIDDSGAPVRGEDGSVYGVVLVFRDATEARRALETRLHLAAIVESSDDAIIGVDLNGRILSWNRGAERLYGYTADEVAGKSLSLLAPLGHDDDLLLITRQIQSGRLTEHYETVRRRKDGSRIDVSLTISPIKDADGQIIGASKIARDVTAFKRNEEALRFMADASKALSELLDVRSTLQRLATLAVPRFADWCIVDLLEPDGSLRRVAVAHANPAKVALAHELYRRFQPDAQKPHGSRHVLQAGQSVLVSRITEAMLAEGVPNEEFRHILQGLQLRSYLGVPLKVRGKAIGVVGFVTAESGRQYGPAEQHLAEDLAQRAGTAIENARLYTELKEADRRKDEFLAMLAHELRNPLAPIRNALQIMKMPGTSPEMVVQAREMTERQVQYMVRLLDDLLDVSRIMRGRIDLRKEPVELAAVVARAAEIAQPALEAHGQELVLSLPAEPVWLEADPMRLTQVISNLLNNAAKYSPQPDRVWLTVERDGGEALVRVRDGGIGIAPELLPHIFDLFVQGNTSLERTQGGLGIGLTIVRRLVELHGGKVSAHSEGLGKGSEFVVRLPAAAHALLAQAPAAATKPTEAAARRILVVDDNVDAAESLAVILRLWGHEVRMAHSGAQALQAADAFEPQVVLLDIGLPEINGYEVARFLRQRPHFQQAMLVAVTGYGQDDDRRRSQEAGFNFHLTKPVTPEDLQRLLSSPAALGRASPGPS